MKVTGLGLAAVAAIFAAASAHADITYVVDHTYGAGSVVGTITTDGTIGDLNPSDFVSWDLTISDGTESMTLDKGNSVENNTSNIDVFATSKDLEFNFGLPGATFYFIDTTPNSSICWSGFGTNGCNISTDSTVGASIIVDNSSVNEQITALSGSNYIIGIASVPEPAAWALMLTGFAGLGAALRTKRRILAAL